MYTMQGPHSTAILAGVAAYLLNKIIGTRPQLRGTRPRKLGIPSSGSSALRIFDTPREPRLRRARLSNKAHQALQY